MRGNWLTAGRLAVGKVLLACLALLCCGTVGVSREREPGQEYAQRRARLEAALKAPVVIFGYTGHEDSNPSYVFLQEENFYYLTGHNEEGAALLLVPETGAGKAWTGPHEILYLPPRNVPEERWNGPRLAPTDPGIAEKFGFAGVQPFMNLRAALGDVAKSFSEIYTELPASGEDGYPHAAEWSKWVKDAAPHVTLKDVSPEIATLRSVKSASELALITKAIDASIDAHFAAMRMMRPGLHEYQVAAKMVEVHDDAGCETEAYAPIVGSGFNSTILHYNKLDRQIEDGDIVLLDVGGQYSGYTADVTRTLPANGKFTPRQREIYEIVLGAQNAALAALKPGMNINTGSGEDSLQKIAMDYIDSHGKDRDGRSLGRYYIHGLSHHIGLNVHDPSGPPRALEPGNVITIEPGIYIPEENLGVRIEDDVLITPTGYKLLTARLPRSPDEIERIMAEGKEGQR